MTIQTEIEWKKENLRRTAEYFRTTETGRCPVGFEEPSSSVEDYETFLIDLIERKLKSWTTLKMLREQCSSAFVIYRPVWVLITLRENTVYVADNRVTTAASGYVIREHSAVSRKDNGVVASRTFNLPIAETGVLLADIQFLSKLEKTASFQL